MSNSTLKNNIVGTFYIKILKAIELSKKDFKTIRKERKPKRQREVFAQGERDRFVKLLKGVIDVNIKEIQNSISWSKEELKKLEEIKSRRKHGKHYNRWGD